VIKIQVATIKRHQVTILVKLKINNGHIKINAVSSRDMCEKLFILPLELETYCNSHLTSDNLSIFLTFDYGLVVEVDGTQVLKKQIEVEGYLYNMYNGEVFKGWWNYSTFVEGLVDYLGPKAVADLMLTTKSYRIPKRIIMNLSEMLTRDSDREDLLEHLEVFACWIRDDGVIDI